MSGGYATDSDAEQRGHEDADDSAPRHAQPEHASHARVPAGERATVAGVSARREIATSPLRR
jgi:hypothetical protein